MQPSVQRRASRPRPARCSDYLPWMRAAAPLPALRQISRFRPTQKAAGLQAQQKVSTGENNHFCIAKEILWRGSVAWSHVSRCLMLAYSLSPATELYWCGMRIFKFCATVTVNTELMRYA